ncbi:hypothetical protein T492DRAFT_1006975 [Pavlovales sp. CCMP2436]|nr:hypothetical protein T492DRAFT_1006975 [Pavlovales sp. CCMP2436]
MPHGFVHDHKRYPHALPRATPALPRSTKTIRATNKTPTSHPRDLARTHRKFNQTRTNTKNEIISSYPAGLTGILQSPHGRRRQKLVPTPSK